VNPEPFTLIQGASWLTPEGAVIPVPSFHEEWMHEHPELSRGARNVCELILRSGWVSVALFSGGYLELMVPERRSEGLRKLLREFLARNASRWTKALVMSMDEEGYAMLEPRDLADAELFASRLGSSV
jgi:hypothetical protein